MKQFLYSHREQRYSLCVSRIKRLDHIGNIAFQTGPPRVSVCMKICSCCSLCVHLNRFTKGVRESNPKRGVILPALWVGWHSSRDHMLCMARALRNRALNVAS